MKEYEYFQKPFRLVFALGTTIAFLMASFLGYFDAGLLSHAVFGSSAVYFAISIYRSKPRKIELSEDKLVVPSLNGFFVRRIAWFNIKTVTLYHRNNDSFIRLRLRKGLSCTIFGSYVNCEGPRSRGLEPYQDLLQEIRKRVERLTGESI